MKDFTIHMHPKEMELFDRFISQSKVYLEFGAGGSTIRVLQRSQAKVYSVESDDRVIQFLHASRFIRCMERTRLTLFHADIGEIKYWGFPENKSKKDSFPAYSSAIYEKISPLFPDTVLIDGRFRVACVLKFILVKYPDCTSLIMIHDFWSRKWYHFVLKFIEEVDRAGTLGVFRIRPGINIDEVSSEYNIFKYIPL